jgi:NAD(P)-dependent dehydrogenase (short-subunit alcohol dehydrogenase family)
MPTGRLAGKVAIVTGAATGIGAATVADFCLNGARTIATDINEPGEKLTETLRQYGEEVVRFELLDVREQADWERVVGVCRDAFGIPNVLFNNAGALGSGAPIHEESVEGMEAALAVNTIGPFLGMKAVIPGMLELGGGSIINTSSVWGIYAAPNNAAYHCAKGACHQMTKNAAVTYAPHNIRVNSLLPGYVDTPMSRGVTEEEAKTLIAFTPMGRRADPEEVSGIVSYLASDEASFTVGGTFTVDGGMAAL